ncbi:MAG: L-rhamnose isomerase [Clostridiales bacterium]|nr:L-rhamnose isomerase [Clostridiales bacterium]
MSRYDEAKAAYSHLGVDTEAAIARLAKIPVSVHCWQGDDVCGFENRGETLSGGLQATGDYPGKARNPGELMADFDTAMSLVPGPKRLNIHASYAITDEQVDRDALKPEHFERWVEYARKRKLGLDFNPTFFSHPLASDSLTLSHPNAAIREFWVNHGIACRKVAAYFAAELGTYCLCNVWIPDGYKHTPADRLGPRLRLKGSLDRIFEEKLPGVIDCVESKVFGIGLESCTVGSSEFYTSYAATHPGVYNLLDNGHYHPTEMVSDKIPALLAFFEYVPLHVTKAVRWDSDHVVLLDDELREIAMEIIRNNADSRVLIGLDYFDASINRVAAWVIGARNMKKALLCALLSPNEELRSFQDKGCFTELLAASEDIKTAPLGDVWAEFCRREGVPEDGDWFEPVRKYERDVLLRRGMGQSPILVAGESPR